jgi:sugar O-acyltransferase (sialic acid O-acetyltransferase NeuD family)
MKRLAVLGAGGHGHVVADTALAAGWNAVALFDDQWPRIAPAGPWPVEGDVGHLIRRLPDFDGVIVAIGHCASRWALHEQLRAAGARFATVVHPGAQVSPHALVGAGSVLMAGTVLQFGARIGDGVIVNTGATVDHDCIIEDGVHLCPGTHLGGRVHVGRLCWVGIGSSIRQGIRIGVSVTIGAGAAVVDDLPDGVTAVGVPARPLAR